MILADDLHFVFELDAAFALGGFFDGTAKVGEARADDVIEGLHPDTPPSGMGGPTAWMAGAGDVFGCLMSETE